MDKKTKRITILFGAMLLCFLAALLMLYAASKDSAQNFLKVPAYCLFAAGVVPFGIAVFFMSKEAIAKGRIQKEYLTYPVEIITDFKGELISVRTNFEADADIDKNRILKNNYNNVASFVKPYYDHNVVKIGTIYYGALVQANDKLFKKSKLFPVLPGNIVYSTDSYYDNNPQELTQISQELFSEKNSNILQFEKQYFSNMLLPPEKTNGREVYMTTVMISREHLPQYRLCGGLFPIIAAPGHSTSVFIVDCKYWTNNLIANFIHHKI